jgi:hypothetical protein
MSHEKVGNAGVVGEIGRRHWALPFCRASGFWAQIGVWGSQSREDKCRSTFHNRGRAKLENRICAPAKSRKSGAE